LRLNISQIRSETGLTTTSVFKTFRFTDKNLPQTVHADHSRAFAILACISHGMKSTGSRLFTIKSDDGYQSIACFDDFIFHRFYVG
jgi:hypothetical protein